ncbi:hypothetical protein QBC45DRAFT_394174 [Copromyces sp. CBS 386.78]|nr:hypothetical protein QBC45DRAFT_394174 [Copromyces sp. CBS 386.78]
MSHSVPPLTNNMGMALILLTVQILDAASGLAIILPPPSPPRDTANNMNTTANATVVHDVHAPQFSASQSPVPSPSLTPGTGNGINNATDPAGEVNRYGRGEGGGLLGREAGAGAG